MLALSHALKDRGTSPVVFAPKRDVERLSLIYSVEVPEIVDFQSRTAYEHWLEDDQECWTSELPVLDDYDEVVSDNLIEVLTLRPDAWLSGTFFWHKALPNIPQQKIQRAEDLLSQHNPRLIASKLFATPYLGEKTKLFNVGLYTLGTSDGGTGQGDILISCGKGGKALFDLKVLLESLVGRPQPGPFTVWVEPILYLEEMPSWIRPASFTPAMYSRLAAAVIRPGIGTLTDCLAVGARLFLFYEPGNLEMKANANKIKEHKFGDVFCSINESWGAALKFLNANKNKRPLNKNAKKLNFNGAAQAADILLGKNLKVSH